MNIFKELGKGIKRIAPIAGGLLANGNPIAFKMITKALGAKEGIKPNELLKQLTASPDLQAKLKQFELNNELELSKLHIEDLESARNMGAELSKSESLLNRNITPALAFGTVLGFIVVLAFKITGNPATSADPALNLLLGALSTMVAKVFDYYFGSSAGSAKKNATIERLKNSNQ
jgi:hypothetical protein